MTRKKTVEETVTPVPEVEPEETGEKVAKVYRAGVLQREYSLAVHGKAYKALAEEFAKKNGYEVRV